MRILHILSQRPDSTGSGIYLQAMLRQAKLDGYTNGLIAAINENSVEPLNFPQEVVLSSAHTSIITFNSEELPFLIPGMSDVMPYESCRFQDLNPQQIDEYFRVFENNISKMIHSFKPDIIHSHHLWLVSSIIKSCFPDIPLVTSCHGSDLRQFQLCPHFQKRVRQGCSQIDRIFALSKSQKAEIHSLYGIDNSRIVITRAGFNEQIFHYSPKPSLLPIQIVYCGKLSRAKGVPYLLRALEKIDSYHFHLVGHGSGTEMQECLNLSKKLGQNITVHGSLPQDKLSELLKRSHIFVLPSLFEGLPLVILEALACGCRVITTNLPGCIEIQESIDTPELITLVSLPRLHSIDKAHVEDIEDFIDNIKKTLRATLQSSRQDPPLNQQSIENNIKSYSWSKIFSKIEREYRHLVS